MKEYVWITTSFSSGSHHVEWDRGNEAGLKVWKESLFGIKVKLEILADVESISCEQLKEQVEHYMELKWGNLPLPSFSTIASDILNRFNAVEVEITFGKSWSQGVIITNY